MASDIFIRQQIDCGIIANITHSCLLIPPAAFPHLFSANSGNVRESAEPVVICAKK